MSLAQITGDDDAFVAKVDAQGALLTNINSVLTPANFDTIELGYTGSDLTTVVYKLATVTVATLTLTYSGGNLIKVERT
jgi:hypothetical protein